MPPEIGSSAPPENETQKADRSQIATTSPDPLPRFSLNDSVDPVELIVLTGFMGAGKTTVGLLLARTLAWRFVDADTEIEAAAGATIAQLFAERGEPWFRQLEHETICRLLSQDSPSGPLILALGGGAIEDERTRCLLLASKATRLVHLEASLETVLRRCQGTGSLRPVLQDKLNLENRYLQRLPLYRQSHLTIAVDTLRPDAVVRAILEGISAEPQ